MNVYKVSASNLQTFLSCQYSYKLRYHDRVKGIKLSNKWTTPGSAVHATLERYFRQYETQPINFNEFSKVLAEEFGNYGVGAAEYKNTVAYMKVWANRFRIPHNILELEYEIDITLPNGIPVKGYIDMIGEKKDGTILLYDWKTGNNPFTDDELEDSVQAPIYILAMKQKYPDRKIEFVFDFLKHNQIFYTYTNDQMKSFIKWFKGVVTTIENTNPETVVPTLGNGCKFCEYRDICPAMQQAKEGGFQFDAETSEDINILIKQQRIINGYSSALYDENKRLKKLILAKMDEEVYESDTHRVKIVRKSTVKHNTAAVIKAFTGTDAIGDVVSVSTSGLRNHLEELPEHLRSEIEDTARNSFAAPYILVTEKKRK